MSVEIGRRLRRARELTGLTLQEVERRTRISKRDLLAIEQGRFNFHSNPAYIRSCVRAYANVVGENPEQILKPLRQTQEMTARRGQSSRRYLPAEEEIEREVPRSRRRPSGYGRSNLHREPAYHRREDRYPDRDVYQPEAEGIENKAGEGVYSRRSRRQNSQKKPSVWGKIYSYFLISGTILLMIATICFLWFRWSHA